MFDNYKREIPFVGKEEPMLRLYEEYHNETIKKNILRLTKEYSTFSRVRGDGNCFYRAVLYEYFRFFSSGKYEETIKKLVKKIKDNSEVFEKIGKEFKVPIKTEFFLNTLKNIERTVIQDLMVLQKGDSNDLVMFVRCCVAVEELNQKEVYSNFLYLSSSYNDHLRNNVLKMGEEADHVEILAFSNFFFGDAEFGLEINRMNRSYEVTRNTFPEDSKRKEKIALFYRPGHYDILN